MRRALFRAVALTGTTACIACGDAALDPLPFQVGIDASRSTAAPGDTVTFIVTAQGGSLFGVEMDYGDASGEQYGTSGARTARVTFRHVYAATGAYQVEATVTDAVAGQKKASVSVRVN